MKCSLNEIQSLAAKAARGAGAEPAQAAHFGRAAVTHLVQGRDPALLNVALQNLPRGPISTMPITLVEIIEHGGGQIDGPDDLARSYVESLPCVASMSNDGTVKVAPDRPASRSPIARCELPDAMVDSWKRLAARTFVPESEASRRSGAGAGLVDND